MTAMTIERTDETVAERMDRFLQIMDRVFHIVGEIRALEIKVPRDFAEEHYNDIFKQAQHVLDAALAAVEQIGVNFIERYEGTE